MRTPPGWCRRSGRCAERAVPSRADQSYRRPMWVLASVVVLTLIVWGFVRLAQWSREAGEDLASMEPSEDEKYGVWGIFRRRR